ncbi:MAG: OmpA family protein [Candidatus Zixiibacteriota bacterium]
MLFIILTILAGILPAEEIHRFSIGLEYGLTTPMGGKAVIIDPSRGAIPYKFTMHKTIGLKLGTNINKRLSAELSIGSFKNYDDSSASGNFQIGSDAALRSSTWQGYNIILMFKYRFMPHPKRLGLLAGLGGGLFNWRINDYEADTTFDAPGEIEESLDLAVSEVTFSGLAGAEYRVSKNIMLGFDIQLNYLTGWGQEFASGIEKNLPNFNFKAAFQINYLFSKKQTAPPPTIVNWGSTEYYRPVSGIISPLLIQESRVAVDVGTDSDRDGIPDANDDCPETPIEAAGLVDIRGCPVDSDCDGIENYRDKCPFNTLGAKIDKQGCPLDSDNDGVFDGLDDCPDSDPELGVDESGCIDLTPIEKPITLYINYQSGSFEIDEITKEKLRQLNRTLTRAPGIKIEINGYTDNIGTSEANKDLSQKRANRIKDFLIRLGIAPERITAVGRGETNFIASNNDREGRQKNRRVELVFYK